MSRKFTILHFGLSHESKNLKYGQLRLNYLKFIVIVLEII